MTHLNKILMPYYKPFNYKLTLWMMSCNKFIFWLDKKPSKVNFFWNNEYYGYNFKKFRYSDEYLFNDSIIIIFKDSSTANGANMDKNSSSHFYAVVVAYFDIYYH